MTLGERGWGGTGCRKLSAAEPLTEGRSGHGEREAISSPTRPAMKREGNRTMNSGRKRDLLSKIQRSLSTDKESRRSSSESKEIRAPSREMLRAGSRRAQTKRLRGGEKGGGGPRTPDIKEAHLPRPVRARDSCNKAALLNRGKKRGGGKGPRRRQFARKGKTESTF